MDPATADEHDRALDALTSPTPPPAVARQLEVLQRDVCDRARGLLSEGRLPDLGSVTERLRASCLAVLPAEAGSKSRGHMLAVAASALRGVLTELTRARMAADPGAAAAQGGRAPASDSVCLVELDRALTRLSDWDQAMVGAAELLLYAGCSEAETARILHLSERRFAVRWGNALRELRKSCAIKA